MYRDWYLLESPSILSGFESDALDDFAGESFLEILNTSLGSDVELCNYDLSVCLPIRVIIQNNTADTKSNTLIRQVLAPIGTCKAGMYIRYKERYWLIVGLVDDNHMYEKAVVVLCNCLISWINADNAIIQRWASSSSASQYNNGETGTKYYEFRTDQLMVLTPDDDESLLIDHGQRFIIDKRCKVYEKQFNADMLCDTSNPVTVYRLTRTDTTLFDYQDSGHSEFMAYQDEQHENDGYYVVDGKGYWLCDIPSIQNESPILSCSIECECDVLYPSVDPCICSAKFYDEFGCEVQDTPKWSIESDVLDKLNVEYVEQAIIISTDDSSCINHTIKLTLCTSGYQTSEIEIKIKAFL